MKKTDRWATVRRSANDDGYTVTTSHENLDMSYFFTLWGAKRAAKKYVKKKTAKLKSPGGVVFDTRVNQ